MAQCGRCCCLLWPSVGKVCAEGKRRYGLCTRSVMVVAIFCCAARQVFFLWHGFHHGAGLGTSILATLGYATSRNGGGGGGFTAMRRARRRRRPPLLSTLLPMAATTHRIRIFNICSKIICISQVPYTRHHKPLSFISRGFWALKKNQEVMAALHHKPQHFFQFFCLFFYFLKTALFLLLIDRVLANIQNYVHA